MSDIVCSYKIRDTDRSGYFGIDSNSNLRQLRQFVSREFFEGARPIRIIAKGKGPVKNDEILQEILRSGEVEFTFVKMNAQDKPLPAKCQPPCSIEEKRVEEPMEVSQEEFALGTNLRAIFSQLGVSVDQDPKVLRQQLEQLPAPLPNLVRQYARQGSQSPKIVQRASNQLSRLFGVPKKDLVPEIRDLLAFVSAPQEESAVASPVMEKEGPVHKAEPDAPKLSSVELKKRCLKKIKPNVVHQAICDECKQPIQGIRYKCLQCPDFDYCASCENSEEIRSQHPHDHVFAKLHRPRDYHTIQRLKQDRPVQPRPRDLFMKNLPPRQSQPRSVCKMPRVEALEKSVKQLEEQVSQLMSPSQ